MLLTGMGPNFNGSELSAGAYNYTTTIVYNYRDLNKQNDFAARLGIRGEVC